MKYEYNAISKRCLINSEIVEAWTMANWLKDEFKKISSGIGYPNWL